MAVILDTIELSMLRDELAVNNVGRFNLVVTASGDTNGGGTLLEYRLSQYGYGEDTVKGADLTTVRHEFIRRYGWQQRNDPQFIEYSAEEVV